MRLLDSLEYAFSDYTSNKFKTAMSSLGIIIGVMAIVVMLTLGNGLTAGVSKSMGGLELDSMTVLPMSINMGGGSAQGVAAQKPAAQFSDRDVNLIASTPGVAGVYPEISFGNALVTSKGENRSVSVLGVLPQNEAGRYGNQMDNGRFLKASDTYSVVLGGNVANGTFSRLVRTGSYITITNANTGVSHDYKVVGILKQINASFMTGDPNSAIFMSKAGLQAISDEDAYTYITVKADSVQTVDTTAKAVQDSISRLHRDEAYTVITQKMFADLITTVFSMITYTLTGIGAISLVVGGIGIMNVMTLTVKERTKEIGLMKAVGATTTDVRKVFLLEAAILGFVSGVLGVVAAWIIALVVGNLAGLSMPMSIWNVLLGVGFGLAVTVIFGVYPANQAAKMDPIEALRTE